MHIDLNCDLGESFGIYKLGMDDEVIKLVSSVNIACGWHAGDPSVMARTVRMAMENDVSIGCHPGFNDLEGFGRRGIDMKPEALKHAVMYQIGALNAFVKSEGGTLSHVKPHGAMYNMAAKDAVMARAIAEAVFAVDSNLILLGLAGSELVQAARETGLQYAQEGFADRSYQDDGTLVPRTSPGAVIEDASVALRQALDLVERRAIESLCVHGDNPKALEFVKTLRRGLEDEGFMLKGLGRLK